MRKLFPLALVALAALLQTSTVEAQSRSWSVQRIRSTFRSEAQLETINGISNRGSGSLTFDPANLGSVSGRIEVPVASIATGIEERDEHLHGARWLDAAGHPNAVFEIVEVTGATALQNGETSFSARGRFTIHGQTHDVNVQARVRWDGGDEVQARARFTIRLDQYGVSIPAVARLKVNNEISVSVRIRLGAG